jgi:hypothetical protein
MCGRKDLSHFTGGQSPRNMISLLSIHRLSSGPDSPERKGMITLNPPHRMARLAFEAARARRTDCIHAGVFGENSPYRHN